MPSVLFSKCDGRSAARGSQNKGPHRGCIRRVGCAEQTSTTLSTTGIPWSWSSYFRRGAKRLEGEQFGTTFGDAVVGAPGVIGEA